MPPVLASDNGDHLMFQNEDGSFFPVAKNSVSPEILQSFTGNQPQASVDPAAQGPAAAPGPQIVPRAEPSPSGQTPWESNPDAWLRKFKNGELSKDNLSDYTTNGMFDSKKYALLNGKEDPLSASHSLEEFNQEKTRADQIANADAEQKAAALKAYNTQAAQLGLPTQGAPPATPSLSDQLNKGTSNAPEANSIPPALDPNHPQSALKEIQTGFDMQRKAADEGARIGIQKANETSAYQQQYAKNLEDFQIQQKEKFNRQQLYLKTEQDKYQKLADDFRDTKIQDPWASKPIGQKIGAAISIALGALGSSLDGSHTNQALGIINNAIDREINIQKANLEKKRQGVDLEGNMVAMVRNQFSDENQQDAVLRSLYLDKVKADLTAIASKYDAPQIKQNVNNAIGLLKVQEQQLRQQFTGGALDNFTKLQTVQHPQLTPEQAKNLSESQQLKEAADSFLKLQNAPSLLGKTFNTQASGLVDEANAKAYSALYGKPPAGKEYDDWKSSPEALSYHDVGKPQLIQNKVANLQKQSSMRMLGAGRPGAIISEGQK